MAMQYDMSGIPYLGYTIPDVSGISGNQYGLILPVQSNPNNVFNISYMGDLDSIKESYWRKNNPAYYIVYDLLYYYNPKANSIKKLTGKNIGGVLLLNEELNRGSEEFKNVRDIILIGKCQKFNNAQAAEHIRFIKSLAKGNTTAINQSIDNVSSIKNGFYKDNEYYYRFNNGDIVIVSINGNPKNIVVEKGSGSYSPIIKSILVGSSKLVNESEVPKPERKIRPVSIESVPVVAAEIKSNEIKSKAKKKQKRKGMSINAKLAIFAASVTAAVFAYKAYSDYSDNSSSSNKRTK